MSRWAMVRRMVREPVVCVVQKPVSTEASSVGIVSAGATFTVGAQKKDGRHWPSLLKFRSALYIPSGNGRSVFTFVLLMASFWDRLSIALVSFTSGHGVPGLLIEFSAGRTEGSGNRVASHV